MAIASGLAALARARPWWAIPKACGAQSSRRCRGCWPEREHAWPRVSTAALSNCNLAPGSNLDGECTRLLPPQTQAFHADGWPVVAPPALHHPRGLLFVQSRHRHSRYHYLQETAGGSYVGRQRDNSVPRWDPPRRQDTRPTPASIVGSLRVSGLATARRCTILSRILETLRITK